jgi:hypothetical protein
VKLISLLKLGSTGKQTTKTRRLTEPAALEFLADQKNSTVYIANPEVSSRPGFRPAQAYHPKLYLFDGSESTGYVVGSANLTSSALVSNTEVVSAGIEVPSNSSWDDVWKEVFYNSSLLLPNILRDYKKIWNRPKLRAIEPDSSPVEPSIRRSDTKVFWEAIENKEVNPSAFTHFWVEAGSMSSGGSHNQLELPRGANRFFGYAYNDYGAAGHVVDIGHPNLTMKGKTWSDKPLRWHSNNKMERFNLPTKAQGGFDYAGCAVLFRRHILGFEIVVANWSDDAAIAWRTASQNLGTVFRLGRVGQRIFGLF